MEYTLPNDFKYEFFIHNRYLMPKLSPNGIEYEAMCNNGYIKLYTIPGKIYWLVQNTLGHLTPDWKFHVSVQDSDVEKTWDIVAEIFVMKKCRSSMKVKYMKENKVTVRGREITIYIAVYDDKYDKTDLGKEFNFNKSIEQNEEFWYDMFDTIEKRLKENGIKSNGVARGDLALGEYVSLRNEAFIPDSETEVDIYPPDRQGWNAANHPLPFDVKRFKRVKETSSGFLYIGFWIMALIVFIISRVFSS